MPFLDDTGVDTSERSPLWSPFTIIADQLERLVVLNVAWAIQWLPALAAFGWPELPLVVRVVLIGYTLIAYAPATVVLYGMTRLATQGEPLTLYLATDLLKTRSLDGAKALMPLVGLIGVLILGGSVPVTLISAVCQLALLFVLVFSNYWGVLIAARDLRNPVTLLLASARLVWQYPAQTLLVTGAVLIAVVLGTISVGGWVLIVPVVIALLQTQMFRSLMEK
jgi:hypothetical protein